MAAILVVCTGNVCRSPIAEGAIRASLLARFGGSAPDVASAGTAGWEGSGADPGSVEAAAERGIDISRHRARGIEPGDVAEASLVVAMSGEHREQVARLVPEASARTFTLKELVRLLETRPARNAGVEPLSLLRARVAEASELRRDGFEGNPLDEDVGDPLGMPFEVFRAIAGELEEWCGRLAEGLFGRAPARARAGGD